MSYCRWSSEDYQCDVYVYEAAHGYITHVAGRRRVYTEPLPPPVEAGDIQGWIKRVGQVRRLADRATLVDIGGPHDGESYTDATPNDCADRLEYLRTCGYNVPQYAIDELRSEAAADFSVHPTQNARCVR
jgi:hypothetical protein